MGDATTCSCGAALAAEAASSHTCALTTAGGVKCWGEDLYGQLGEPLFTPRLTPVRTLGFGQVDFDRDDLVDVAVYRPSAGTWFSLASATGNSTFRHRGWGVEAQGDLPAPRRGTSSSGRRETCR